MKKIKLFIIETLKKWPMLLLVLGSTFSCYMITPGLRTNTTFFVAALVCSLVFVLLSIGYIILIYKKGDKKINNLFTIISFILISGLILTVVLRIISAVNPNLTINKNGLVSLIVLFTYYMIIIVLSVSLFRNSDKFIEHEI